VKQKREHKSHTFAPVTLYREEIEELLSLVSGLCEHIELSDEKNVYDSLDEMEDRLGNRFHYLQIQGTKPYANIALGTEPFSKWLRHDDNHVYVHEAIDGGDGELLLSRVQNFVSQHQRRVQYFFNYPVFLLVILIDATILWLRHSHLHLSPAMNEIVSVTDETLFFGYLLVFTYFNFRGKSRISFVRRNKRQSFLQRNSDNLMMVVIGAAIGIFGTLATEWLKHTLFSK